MSIVVLENGLRMNACIEGPADAPVVVLSNSLMSNLGMWEGQMPVLTEKYRVLRYDQRGHGATEVTPGPYTIELLADDAYYLIREFGIDQVHFLGLSMGGFTAQMLAVRHPEVVRSLILADTACVMPPESLWNDRIETAGKEGMEALLPGTLKRWFSFDVEEATLNAIKEMILATKPEGFIACAHGIRDMRICDNLPKIKVPTIVMVGSNDPSCPLEAAEQLHAGIKGSEYVVIENAAHLPNIEQREIFNKTILDFLARQ